MEKLKDAIEATEEEAHREHELGGVGAHAHHEERKASAIGEDPKLLENGNLPPPPMLPPPFSELSASEAALELQARLDRIEDLLDRAATRCTQAMKLEAAAGRKSAPKAVAARGPVKKKK